MLVEQVRRLKEVERENAQRPRFVVLSFRKQLDVELLSASIAARPTPPVSRLALNASHFRMTGKPAMFSRDGKQDSPQDDLQPSSLRRQRIGDGGQEDAANASKKRIRRHWRPAPEAAGLPWETPGEEVL